MRSVHPWCHSMRKVLTYVKKMCQRKWWGDEAVTVNSVIIILLGVCWRKEPFSTSGRNSLHQVITMHSQWCLWTHGNLLLNHISTVQLIHNILGRPMPHKLPCLSREKITGKLRYSELDHSCTKKIWSACCACAWISQQQPRDQNGANKLSTSYCSTHASSSARHASSSRITSGQNHLLGLQVVRNNILASSNLTHL